MTIQLSGPVEALIERKLSEGQYSSPDQLIEHALRLLDEHENGYQARLGDLRREIALGIEQLDRGERVPLDQFEIEKLKAEGRKRLSDR